MYSDLYIFVGIETSMFFIPIKFIKRKKVLLDNMKKIPFLPFLANNKTQNLIFKNIPNKHDEPRFYKRIFSIYILHIKPIFSWNEKKVYPKNT